MFDFNPMDVLQQRSLRTLAPHFSTFTITETELFNGVEDWVKTKLKGRYYICSKPAVDHSGNLRSSCVIGFEDHQELTFFMLACPHLRRTQ
jgi:hypothetical protein